MDRTPYRRKMAGGRLRGGGRVNHGLYEQRVTREEIYLSGDRDTEPDLRGPSESD